MPIDLKKKIQLQLNEDEVKELLKKAVAKELDKNPEDVMVSIQIKTRKEGMQWDPYDVYHVEATVTFK